MQNIKNIIFDLGNVLLDIDTDLSKEAFRKYNLKDFDKLYTLAAQSEIFDRLEVGSISPKDFYTEFRELTNSNLNDKIICNCWNALIIDYTKERIELLQNLRKKFRTFILSNTNIIHYESYTNLLKNKYNVNGLESLVEKAYFSHEKGLKKPDERFYKLILEENNLNPEETLFIDDNKTNIEAAKRLNIMTIYLVDKKLEDLFTNNNLYLVS
ncbi:MAG: HAD family phosphatase [Marinilabiliales bacterium]|nr:MAG: HAD family phosphatase [Marinilabiliales bacterium]